MCGGGAEFQRERESYTTVFKIFFPGAIFVLRDPYICTPDPLCLYKGDNHYQSWQVPIASSRLTLVTAQEVYLRDHCCHFRCSRWLKVLVVGLGVHSSTTERRLQATEKLFTPTAMLMRARRPVSTDSRIFQSDTDSVTTLLIVCGMCLIKLGFLFTDTSFLFFFCSTRGVVPRDFYVSIPSPLTQLSQRCLLLVKWGQNHLNERIRLLIWPWGRKEPWRSVIYPQEGKTQQLHYENRDDWYSSWHIVAPWRAVKRYGDN